MKDLALIICLLFLAVCPIYSQTYTPFPTQDSTVWRVNFYNCDGPYACTGYEEFDFILGDTVLNDKLYSRLYRSTNGLYWDSQFTLPIGFIREEDKKIHYIGYDYANDSTSEVLLYDFNLSVGDTMYWDGNVLSPNDNVPYGIVNQIDSVQMNTGEYRRRFRFSSMAPLEINIIEGIGSNFGLLRPNYFPFESVYELLCLAEPSTLVYDNEYDSRDYADADACLYNPVSTDTPFVSDLKIFPNPTHEVLYFSENISETLLEIYTPIGTKIFEIQNFTGREIDINHLASGMYFIVLGDAQKTAIKVVKN